MSVRITKSKFCAGCQCLRRLYLQVYQPELAAEPDAAADAIIRQGHEVGMLARQLFPGGVEVRCDGGLDEAIRATRALVANPEVQAIFEGVFEHQNVLVKVDILHRRRDGRWRLIEVKSTADFKNHHLEDVAVQYRVVSRSGLDLASACLAHVNRAYIRDGAIDPKSFFKIRNLTRRVQRLQPKLTFQLRSEFTVLAMQQPPDIAPGRHCADPVTCEFYDRCNPPRTDDHIGYLPRIHASAMEVLEEMGIDSIRDIPDDFELSETQRRAATCVQTGEPWYSPVLRQVLGGLTYPLCFADFETVNPAIPPFAGMRPYDQLPYQWSVHVQRQPGAEPEHHEFLAAGSHIITNAHRIRRGQMPDMRGAEPSSDFHFVERDDPEKIAATLVKLVQERIPERFRLDPIRDVQVLCPMNRGSLGVRELNIALQKALNPARSGQPAVERFGWRFQMGDKVIQTENDYDKDVFNGDVGIVERVDMVEQQVAVRFDERLVKYDFGELGEISLAYAITIHKSQGSEFPAVVIPLATQHYMLLQRNLIYTGITRGKRLLVLIGQKKALGIAVRNDRPQRRYSGLLASLTNDRRTGME